MKVRGPEIFCGLPQFSITSFAFVADADPVASCDQTAELRFFLNDLIFSASHVQLMFLKPPEH